MADSNLKIVGTLLLLLVTPLILLAMPITAQEEKPNSMITGILAHEMNESQAKILAEKGFWVEADVEINKPESNWTNIYNLSKKYNLLLIGKLDHITMNWNACIPDLDAWNRTVQTAVNDYKDSVKAWEIWNEPIDQKFFNETIYNGTDLSVKAQNYTTLLKAAYQIIKSSTNAPVIGFGGLQLYSHIDPDVQRGLEFARNVNSSGGLDCCDAISLHAYPWGNYSCIAENSFVEIISEYRNLTEKPIWVTEIGQHSDTHKLNEVDQAYCLYNSYKLLQRQNVSAYIWYELNDAQSRVDANDTFGLFDLNQNPKIALQTFISLKTENYSVNRAVNYLVSNYNSTIKLLRESPDESSTNNTYWIYSDNYLAQLALANYTSENSTIAQIVQNIAYASKDWTENQSIVNQYQILNSTKISLPISDHGNYILGQSGDATINCTINNKAGNLSAINYADIAFLEAISYQNNDQGYYANNSYKNGTCRWDGDGFKDDSYNETRGYDTYKLALYILASKVLNCTFDVRAYNNLLACQISSRVAGLDDAGGFATYYTSNGVTNNQTNTETTALAILALTYQPPITSESSLDPTPTPTPTPSPSTSPSPNQTDSATPNPSPSQLPTPSPTFDLSPSPTPIQSVNPTPSPINLPTSDQFATNTATPTPTIAPLPSDSTTDPSPTPIPELTAIALLAAIAATSTIALVIKKR